tara:strand:- start:788 stop:2764 length:1977 start_codon:yes stop_codon:yes gene_type:complete
MYKEIFKLVKKIIPKISNTELIALRSGTTSLDRDIFKGNVNLDKFKPIQNYNKFPEIEIDNLYKNCNEDFIYPSDKSDYIMNYLGKNKFWSYIIHEKYGGTNLSVNELSSVLTKITSFSPSLGVITMVPNSLGPGELLLHYGTNYQKNKYLPGLANGDYIPCFGLTGPNNGSDATGPIDRGVVKYVDNKKVIEIEINKRYITLAPVANLIGLAFNLDDPDDILESGSEGITVALIESDHIGLKKDTYHNPLNIGFPNGTLKGKIQIPLEQVIGGEENCGHGWQMLMECLAAGRGICLPATALASSNVATYGIFNYAKHRRQFNIPLIKMQGVQSKFVDMLFNTWLINCSVKLTNTILDMGEKPAVISAIMKQQTTDRGREVLNNAMDIHAGSSICLGENNFLEKFYRSAPVGITVEGSNTLTKNLIIFGQGLNKSHPYIYPVLDSVLTNDLHKFEKVFSDIVGHSLNVMGKSAVPCFSNDIEKRLKKQTINFSHLSNIIALKGGAIKKEQFLSADMADIFSNLYLSYAVLWHHNNYKTSSILTDYCINRLLNNNQIIINKIVDNSNFLYKIPILHLKGFIKSDSYNDNTLIVDEVLNNNKIVDVIKEDIYVKDNVLEKMEHLNNLDYNSDEYRSLYDEIIKVGEYSIPENIDKSDPEV